MIFYAYTRSGRRRPPRPPDPHPYPVGPHDCRCHRCPRRRRKPVRHPHPLAPGRRKRRQPNRL